MHTNIFKYYNGFRESKDQEYNLDVISENAKTRKREGLCNTKFL